MESEERTVILFDLPANFCTESLQIAALHSSGAFLPVMEVDPGPLLSDYFLCFKVVIKGHRLQSNEAPLP
ncbi:MAG: hypothetical protein WAW42_02160 [Candidatus Competibacteraceae bacterium]|jgi:hypothetical protein